MEQTPHNASAQGIRFLLGVLLVAALCSMAWTGYVRRNNLCAALAESGGQTNLIRLSSLLNGADGAAVFVGSSLTGRLMPAYFPPGTVTNFALEGCGSIDGINLLLALKKSPRVLFVEENSLTREVSQSNTFLSDSAKSVQVRLSKHLPLLRPEFRPSSVTYSWLKSKIDDRRSSPATSDEGENALARQQISGNMSTVEKNRQMFLDLAKLLHSQGVEVCVFRIPDGLGAFPDVDLPESGASFSRADLRDEYRSRFGPAHYSDGLHFLAKDARQFAELLRSTFPNLLPGSSPEKQ